MRLNLSPCPLSPWFPQWAQMSSKDPQREEYIKGLPIKTILISWKSEELKLLQGLSNPKYSIWPPPALLPQVAFDDQHQGSEDQDALAARLPHPADGLGPGQVREVVADPGPRGLTPVQLPLAEKIHKLPPASMGRTQVQVRPWIFRKHIFKIKFFDVLRDYFIERNCSRVKYIDKVIRLPGLQSSKHGLCRVRSSCQKWFQCKVTTFLPPSSLPALPPALFSVLVLSWLLSESEQAENTLSWSLEQRERASESPGQRILMIKGILGTMCQGG